MAGDCGRTQEEDQEELEDTTPAATQLSSLPIFVPTQIFHQMLPSHALITSIRHIARAIALAGSGLNVTRHRALIGVGISNTRQRRLQRHARVLHIRRLTCERRLRFLQQRRSTALRLETNSEICQSRLSRLRNFLQQQGCSAIRDETPCEVRQRRLRVLQHLQRYTESRQGTDNEAYRQAVRELPGDANIESRTECDRRPLISRVVINMAGDCAHTQENQEVREDTAPAATPLSSLPTHINLPRMVPSHPILTRTRHQAPRDFVELPNNTREQTRDFYERILEMSGDVRRLRSLRQESCNAAREEIDSEERQVYWEPIRQRQPPQIPTDAISESRTENDRPLSSRVGNGMDFNSLLSHNYPGASLLTRYEAAPLRIYKLVILEHHLW